MRESKKVDFDISSVDGNAFSLMGGFLRAARMQGFDKDFIDDVLKKCKSSDYDNLIKTLLEFTE